MQTARVYTPQPLAVGAGLSLEPAASHHLLQVLRLKPGAQLLVFNGDGHDYTARLLAAGRRSARLQLLQRSPPEPPPRLMLDLGLCLSKGDRMDFAVQKSVELGVSLVTPLLSERCMVRLPRQRMQKRLQHWRAVAIAACEQSGRRRLPQLNDTALLPDWLALPVDGHSLLLDPNASITLAQLPPPDGGVRLLIGPEGGLSEAERLQADALGFSAVRLGPRVLRTETAPLAAIAAIQVLWGDFSS